MAKDIQRNYKWEKWESPIRGWRIAALLKVQMSDVILSLEHEINGGEKRT